MQIDLRDAAGRFWVVQSLARFHEAMTVLLGAVELGRTGGTVHWAPEHLGEVTAADAVVRFAAARADAPGRAALRPLLADLAGLREDLQAASRAPGDDPDALLDGADDEWNCF